MFIRVKKKERGGMYDILYHPPSSLVRYVLLPAHLGTQWNKMGVISQALELLENMRKSNILPRDEVSYSPPLENC